MQKTLRHSPKWGKWGARKTRNFRKKKGLKKKEDHGGLGNKNLAPQRLPVWCGSQRSAQKLGFIDREFKWGVPGTVLSIRLGKQGSRGLEKPGETISHLGDWGVLNGEERNGRKKGFKVRGHIKLGQM